MKTCFVCERNKEDSEFHKNSRHRDGLQSRCKECQKILNRKHYEENKTRYIRKARDYKNESVERLSEIKRQAGCYFCGEREPCCLDFHHKDGKTKEYNLSKACRDVAWSKVEKEIQKCIVVCKNCHAKVHAGLIAVMV